MAKDPRQRGINRHATVEQKPIDIQWASDTQRQVFEYGPWPQCASGGFGCIAGDVRIYCADQDLHVRVRDLHELGIAPVVLAWNGAEFVKQKASAPFIKGEAKIYRVRTRSGRSIDVTDQHRFLTEDGAWSSMKELLFDGVQSAKRLRVSAAGLLPTTSDTSRSVRPADDRHCSDTGEDFPDDYQDCLRLRDARLLLVGDSALSRLPSLDDALVHIRCAHRGAMANMSGYSARILLDLLSNLDASGRASLLDSILANYGPECSGVSAHASSVFSVPAEFLGNSDRSRQAGGFGHATEEVSTSGSALDSILSVEDLGTQVYYDISVPEHENYLAEGFINHNSSKSWAFCLKALWLSSTFPNNRGIIARQQYEMLKHTTMSTFYKICPPAAYLENGKRSDSEKYLRLNNGSEVLWMHMDDPETENVIRGLEINWFFIDQCEEIQEEIFDMLMTRLGRWDKAEVPQWMIDKELAEGRPWAWINPANSKPLVPTYPMIACNPDTELHWIYRRFHPDSGEHWEKRMVDPETGNRRSYHDLGYKMFTMSSRENKFLPKQNLEIMLSKDESFVRRFVEGKWGIPEGQIHIIAPLSYIDYTPELIDWIRQTCTLHRVLDHGDAAPTSCGWFAVDRSGNVIFYREYYQPNQLISYHRREITELSTYERYQFNLADPSIFFKTQQKHGGMWATSDEYSDCKYQPRETALFWQPADKNELGTRNRINEYLRVDPERVHPTLKTKGAPRLFFIRRSEDYPQGCYHIIRETRSQRRKKIGSEGGRAIFCDERDDKIADHGYDCLAGDTLIPIWTAELGLKSLPIKSLVGTEGKVCTPYGWQDYRDCKLYRESSAMVRVEFSNGQHVESTPDHRFYVLQGWCQAKDLLGRDACCYLIPGQPQTYEGHLEDRLLRVTGVSEIDPAYSYCLTVDHPFHGFFLENGIVVHNCVRYAIASRPPMATEPTMQAPAKSYKRVREDYKRWKHRGGFKLMAREQARRAERNAANI